MQRGVDQVGVVVPPAAGDFPGAQAAAHRHWRSPLTATDGSGCILGGHLRARAQSSSLSRLCWCSRRRGSPGGSLACRLPHACGAQVRAARLSSPVLHRCGVLAAARAPGRLPGECGSLDAVLLLVGGRGPWSSSGGGQAGGPTPPGGGCPCKPCCLVLSRLGRRGSPLPGVPALERTAY